MSQRKRLLVVQLSCAYQGQRWDREWIRVKDGGDCFVQVIFDVDTQQYLIETHGEA